MGQLILKKHNTLQCNCEAVSCVCERWKVFSLPQFAQGVELHRIDDVQAALGEVTADLLHIPRCINHLECKVCDSTISMVTSMFLLKWSSVQIQGYRVTAWKS